jgi:hypothetical protein
MFKKIVLMMVALLAMVSISYAGYEFQTYTKSDFGLNWVRAWTKKMGPDGKFLMNYGNSTDQNLSNGPFVFEPATGIIEHHPNATGFAVEYNGSRMLFRLGYYDNKTTYRSLGDKNYEGMNDHNIFVGSQAGVSRIWDNGNKTIYPTLQGFDHLNFRDINNDNIIVGWATRNVINPDGTSYTEAKGVKYDYNNGMSMSFIEIENARVVTPQQINDLGDIVGNITFHDGTRTRFVLYGDGRLEYIDDFNGYLSGIDNNRNIVGYDASNEIVYYGKYISAYYDVTVSGQGGTTDYDGINTVAEGNEITITAIPNEGYGFTEWVGVPEDLKYNNPLTITVESDMNIVATFGLVPIDVTMEIDPSFNYIDNKKHDILTIRSKHISDMNLVEGETVPVEVTIKIEGKGVNGGDLYLKGYIDPYTDNGTVLKTD